MCFSYVVLHAFPADANDIDDDVEEEPVKRKNEAKAIEKIDETQFNESDSNQSDNDLDILRLTSLG